MGNRGKQETKERILRGKFHTPAFLTPQAQDLIRRLLRRPVERRLGSKDGATEVKSHDFFGVTCWEKVLKKGYKPPFVPSFNGDDDFPILMLDLPPNHQESQMPIIA